jgi:hypothetical protein
MVMEPGNPDNILVSTSGTATGGAIYRSTNANAATPTFTQTLFPGFNGLVMKLAINKVGSVVTAYVGSNEPPPVARVAARQSGRVRKSVDGGVTWSVPLPAAEGYCGGQCSYDNPVGVDPTDANIVYIAGNARGTCSDVLARSADGGTTFIRDDEGLHADSHGFAFDPLTIPTTVWFVNDGGVWKRPDATAGTPWLNQNTNGLSTLQFMSIAVHATDPWLTIGGTQDNGTEAMTLSNGNWVSAESGDGGFALIDQSSTDTTNVTMYHTFFNQTNNFIGFDRTNLGSCLPPPDTITPTPAQVCANSTGNSAAGPRRRDDLRLVDRERHDHLGDQHPDHHLHRRRFGHGRSHARGDQRVRLLGDEHGQRHHQRQPGHADHHADPGAGLRQLHRQLRGRSGGATTYAWSIVNGTITSATNIQTITYTAGASGTVDLTLVVTNAAGCSATNTVNVTINANPATPTITPTPAQVCANSTGNSAAGPAGATTYAWSIVNGTITSATNIQTITYTAGASGTVDLTLVVTNAAGCSATNTVNVTINANPATPTITPTPAQVCANSTGNSAAGPAGATTYAWSIVNGTITSATNIQTITYTAGASGTVDLTLVVTNASAARRRTRST